MKRREFLVNVGGALIAVPAVLIATSCGDDDDDGGGGEFSVTSDGDHKHTLVVKCGDLSKTSDVSYTSGPGGANSHTHVVVLTGAQLTMINAGTSVAVSITQPHPHAWVIAKMC